MNLKTVADNLAARFTGITADGEAIAVGPTASLPNAITKGPALLVYPPTGVLDVGASAMRDDAYDFPVRLLRDPMSVPDRTNALYAWFNAMRDRVEMQTGLGLVDIVAQPIALRTALDGIDYAGATFDLVELIVRVRTWEHVTGTGP